MYFFEFSAIAVVFAVVNIVSVSSQGNTYGSTIKFYNGDTLANFVSYDLATAQNVANDPKFNLTRTTMIFFHGWLQSPSAPFSQEILNAYIANGTYNILALDWSQAASGSFNSARDKVEPLGIEVALFIDRLNTQKGLSFLKVHLVGHSLGAHLAGSAGKYTQGWSGQTKYIGRITGLDPAISAVDFLQWRYAKFVDIIHTNAYVSGTNQNTGHCDFWPNGGAAQPGCTTTPITPDEITCSHFRAISFFAESVRRANRTSNFMAVNQANANIVISMGLNCPSNVQGIYNLSTNGASWFSRS